MATRYSGDLIIRMRWRSSGSSPNGEYRAGIFDKKGLRLWSGTVGAPRFMRRAVDSPQAFNDTARSALSFAANEEDDFGNRIGDRAEHVRGETGGWRIRREPYRRVYRERRPIKGKVNFDHVVRLARRYQNEVAQRGPKAYGGEAQQVLLDALLTFYGRSLESKIDMANSSYHQWTSVIAIDLKKAIEFARRGTDQTPFSMLSISDVDWETLRPNARSRSLLRGRRLIFYLGKDAEKHLWRELKWAQNRPEVGRDRPRHRRRRRSR
jgi:hypothetical protein